MNIKNSKYYSKKYSDELKEDWNYVLQNSDDSWIFHNIELNQIYALRDKAVNYSFIVYELSRNKPIAIIPLFIYHFKWTQFYRSNKIYARSYYHSGPAIVKQLGEKVRREIIYYLSAEIESICIENKVDKCTIGSAHLSERSLNQLLGQTNPWHEFRNKWQNVPQVHYYLDLNLPVETLKSNLEVRTRTIVNKFESQSDFTFKKADAGCIDDIYDLFLETHKRTGLPFHPKEEFVWFLNHEQSNYYIAYQNLKAVCVINVATFKNTAMYWSSYTSTAFLNTQIATYMLWYSIIETKKQGVTHFDVGIQPFSPIDSKEDSIAKFKRSFGGYMHYGFELTLTEHNKVQKILQFVLDRL